VIEKYCDLNPALGCTSALSDVIGSATSSGVVNPTVYHYDEYIAAQGYPIDEFLISEVKTHKPSAVIVSYFPVANHPKNIKFETLQKINEEVPVIFIWFDFAHSHIRNLALSSIDYGSLAVVIDVFEKPNDKFLPMWSPRDENLFKLEERKDIDVCFVGSTRDYSERTRFLNFLRNKVNLVISGGQREHNLSIEQYAEVFKRSKISLNFPSKPDGVIQTKGRIYESMLCGALLFERENDVIKNWFEPMIHYVPFNNEGDLLTKLNYFLHHEKERRLITQKANEKMKKDYSSKIWWETVLNRAGVK
jgi:hypothetical protein